MEPISCNLPFDGPGVVHVAADPGEFGGWYQECAVCGDVLQDYTGLPAGAEAPPPWPAGTWVSVRALMPGFRYLDGEHLHSGDVLCEATPQ